ncbi:ATP-binding protein [Spirillospora albida]|uniref:ATP-binding protein n=1 Tax=Spirillospora albida TaxID=58123 RepID=UPI0004BF5908|nr:ATP-binding protein [Spirillospora albida]
MPETGREGMLLALLESVAEVISTSSDLQAAARPTLRVVTQMIGWPIGHMCVPADEPGVFESSGIWEGDVDRFPVLRGVSGRVSCPPGVGGVGMAAVSGRPVWLHDLRRHPDGIRAEQGEVEAGTALAVPVIASDGVVAVLEFFHPQVITPDEILLRVLGNLGHQLGRVVDRHRAQQSADQARRRLEHVIETSVEALVSMDAGGRIIAWNTGAERMFGMTREEAIGQMVHETIVPERFRAADEAGRERFLATGASTVLGRRLELAAIRADGSEFPIELVVWANHENGAWVFHAFIHDITDRRRAEQALRRAYRQEQATVARLKELDHAKDEFVATVSHELRTPLTTILGYLEIVLDDEDAVPHPTRKMLHTVTHNARRLQRLVEDLLAVNTTATGHPLAPRRAPVPVADLFDEAVQRASSETDLGHHPLDLRVDAGLTTIDADRSLLVRALAALLSNAAKFSPRQTTITMHVGAAAAESGSGVAITVTDRGIGIPPEELAHVFDRFSRARTAAEQAIQGVGLGLTIAKTIAEAHEGTLTATSTPGKGTAFTLTIPAAAPP